MGQRESFKGNKKFIELKVNEKTTYQNLWHMAKVVNVKKQHWFWKSGKSTYCIMVAGLLKIIITASFQTKQELSEEILQD